MLMGCLNPCVLLRLPKEKERVGAQRRIIKLGFADHSTLVSSPAGGLQQLMDAVEVWSAAMDMRISAEKTAVCMVTQAHVWQLAAVDLQSADWKQYLGVASLPPLGFSPPLTICTRRHTQLGQSRCSSMAS